MINNRIIFAILYAFTAIHSHIFCSQAPSNPKILEQWFTAAQYGQLKVIQNLSRCIDVNAQNWFGSTALVIASLNGHENIVRFLLKIPDININIKTNNGTTALIAAADPLKGTVHSSENIMKMLLQMPDINVNDQDNDGSTALMLAARRSNFEIVNLLLKIPTIDINAQEKSGWTAFMFASVKQNKNIVKLLLDAGAAYTIKTKYGQTATNLVPITFKPVLEELINEANIARNKHILSALSNALYKLKKLPYVAEFSLE